MPNYTVRYSEVHEYAEFIEAKDEYTAYLEFMKEIDKYTPVSIEVDDVDIA